MKRSGHESSIARSLGFLAVSVHSFALLCAASLVGCQVRQAQALSMPSSCEAEEGVSVSWKEPVGGLGLVLHWENAKDQGLLPIPIGATSAALPVSPFLECEYWFELPTRVDTASPLGPEEDPGRTRTSEKLRYHPIAPRPSVTRSSFSVSDPIHEFPVLYHVHEDIDFSRADWREEPGASGASYAEQFDQVMVTALGQKFPSLFPLRGGDLNVSKLSHVRESLGARLLVLIDHRPARAGSGSQLTWRLFDLSHEDDRGLHAGYSLLWEGHSKVQSRNEDRWLVTALQRSVNELLEEMERDPWCAAFVDAQRRDEVIDGPPIPVGEADPVQLFSTWLFPAPIPEEPSSVPPPEKEAIKTEVRIDEAR